MNNSAFDLPIAEVKGYVGDMMNRIGEKIKVDGVYTTVMLAELQRVYTYIQQNIKKAVFLYETEIKKGSHIEFENGGAAIVYSTPNDDIVSKSAEILLFNSKPEFFRYEEQYNADITSPNYGDRIDKGLVSKGFFDGFIERLSAREKQYDVGLLQNAILRFITFAESDIELNDILKFKDKQYKVIDIDDITEGVMVIQLALVRDYYE